MLKFVANKRSKEVHVQECWWGQMMSATHTVYFDTIFEALQHGFDGCGHCLPEFSNYWNCGLPPITEAIIERGWYWGKQNQMRPGTPPGWRHTGGDSRNAKWQAPAGASLKKT